MTNTEMTNDERGNTDRLSFFKQDKIMAHIILKRKNQYGKNIFLNGYIVRQATDRLWVIDERKMGEIRVSISEIVDDGVKEYGVMG